MIKQRTWAVLFALAGVQLTACSPSQTIPEAEPGSSPSNANQAKTSGSHSTAVAQVDAGFGSGYHFANPQPQHQPRPVRPAPRPQHQYAHQQQVYVPEPEQAYQPQAYEYETQMVGYMPAPPVAMPPMQVNQPIELGSGMPALQWSELRKIGEQIFQNESGGSVSNLVHWNDGENFASMGIGHFTWYPTGRAARFGNTFPQLLDHLERNGVQLPAWVRQARHTGAPWRSKAELMRAKNTAQVKELQTILFQTRELQAQYIVDRTRLAMPKLVRTSPAHLRPLVAQNLNVLANTPGGWYAIIDYVNFKGEGLNRSGGYRGQNWGLLQVLETMRPAQPGQDALNAFADAAMQVLQRRVNNAPNGSGEERWLAGWSRRINTYRAPLA
ncbi:MAG: hypothetical protein WAQ53_06005 [Thiofilum sp.]|uniref:hypothetical protein n=1 Tax=Thiofilum sp. TaxID=2212733 RepID=UPI002600035D|nr:hypothetical protein [Thiofilum sp.]MBK8452232.1 hypothetical protein [Thiofilum sp.]